MPQLSIHPSVHYINGFLLYVFTRISMIITCTSGGSRVTVLALTAVPAVRRVDTFAVGTEVGPEGAGILSGGVNDVCGRLAKLLVLDAPLLRTLGPIQ